MRPGNPQTHKQAATGSRAQLMPWWAAYNAALIERGQPEATLSDARFLWEWGWSPEGAAEHTVEMNRDAARIRGEAV